MTERHAEHGIESDRTACGLAILGVNEDGKYPAILAAPGNVVTCGPCKMILVSAQDCYTANFRRRRLPAT